MPTNVYAENAITNYAVSYRDFVEYLYKNMIE